MWETFHENGFVTDYYPELTVQLTWDNNCYRHSKTYTHRLSRHAALSPLNNIFILITIPSKFRRKIFIMTENNNSDNIADAENSSPFANIIISLNRKKSNRSCHCPLYWQWNSLFEFRSWWNAIKKHLITLQIAISLRLLESFGHNLKLL